jgi:pimeloyl-ACP methyl ester carboxylesterase
LGGWLKKSAIGLALLLAAATAVAFVFQARRDARILEQNPPPGQFVDVGGHNLHYRLLGAGPVTFVLEGGAGEYGATWEGIEGDLGDIGRVFVYDRAGMGWSEQGPHPRTISRIVGELHRALDRANVPGPYVLVGHSLGGVIATLYAMEHSAQVAALLLLDPSHKDQVRRLPQAPAWQRMLATQLTRTAPLGLPRLVFGESDPVKTQTSHGLTFGAEIRGALKSAEDMASAPIDLGDTPIYVLTNGARTRGPFATEEANREHWNLWKGLHEELVESSTSTLRRHIIVDQAGHYIHYDRPEAVVAAAEELVARLTDESRVR